MYYVISFARCLVVNVARNLWLIKLICVAYFYFILNLCKWKQMCIETILYARTRHGIVNIENGILISNEAIESAWLKRGKLIKWRHFSLWWRHLKYVVEFKSYEPRPILHWYTQQLEFFEVLIKSVVTVSKQKLDWMNFKNQQVSVSSSFLFLVLSGFENRRASEMNCRRHERHPPFYFDIIHYQQKNTFSCVSREGPNQKGVHTFCKKSSYQLPLFVSGSDKKYIFSYKTKLRI